MSTIQDYRRTDLRTGSDGKPFWLISNAIDGHEVSGLKDKACVMFSFPKDNQQIIIHEIAVQVLRSFTTGTTLELGLFTLSDDSLFTGGTADEVDDNSFIELTDISPEVPGWYYPTKGDFTDARGSGVTIEDGNLIVGNSTAVPTIVLSPKEATIIIGQARVFLLVSILPGS